IGGDPIGAHHYTSDAAGVQKVSRHVVGDNSGGDPVLLKFPSRQASALKKWTRLVGEDVDLLACADRGADHAQRGAISSRREGTRVAVRQYGFAIRNQRLTVAADGLADGDVFQPNLLGFR